MNKMLFFNLGLLVLGFLAWVTFDFFYVKAGQPDTGIWVNDSWILLFPAVMFCANLFLWRSFPLISRVFISLWVSVVLSALEAGLICFFGVGLHVWFGGY